jgi:diaminopimelate decarboxylase
MSGLAQARRKLNFVDPAAFTPQFLWKNTASGRDVFCENLSLQAIATRFNTPTYVYSKRAIVDAFAELERGLGAVPHTVCFAVKANGNLSILKLLSRLGCGFDIVSGGELDHLGRIGVPGNRIVFSGVGKSREEIRAALRYRGSGKDEQGILQFNIESAPELEILLEEASPFPSAPGVSVRVNPDVKAGGHPHISTGLHEHKFGLTWPEARSLYLAPRSAKRIRWQGISAHIGSQIMDLAPFQQALERLAGYLRDLSRHGIALQYLDFGGGLGVRYTSERPISRVIYARMISRMVKPLGVKLLLEPGRSIIASAGVLLSRVIYTKQNSHKSFVIVDAAMNDLSRPILYGAPHAITRVSMKKSIPSLDPKLVDVVGPVCETGDCFLQDWPLGEVSSGDLVAIWTAGAYGMVQASNYNGRCRPAEVLVSGTRATLIRRRETPADLLRTDVLA